jgi:hypothetical protein
MMMYCEIFQLTKEVPLIGIIESKAFDKHRQIGLCFVYVPSPNHGSWPPRNLERIAFPSFDLCRFGASVNAFRFQPSGC